MWAWQTFIPARRTEGPSATAWRNLLAIGTGTASAPPVPATLTPSTGTPFNGMLTWLFEEIARWKKAEGYSDTIGKDLGVIGPAASEHTDPPFLIENNVAQNNVELGFTLYEHDGVWTESQRQGDAAFAFLAIDTAAPYNDTRPVKVAGQAEWRDYRACWWDNDAASMDFGPVLRVLVQG